MDKEQVIELARTYKEVISKKIPVTELFLYGSYSKGNYNDDSDVDIAVIVDKLSDNYLEDATFLWRTSREINSLIEPVLLTADSVSPLYYDIKNTGIRI
ncbi:MAG: nucleotidyltransferase domain-containing protein [Bacteroidales bacterium]|jgi:predicted nucleotidyltransferase|nr:nucleotidyltransferase domain-containing protein [Bacteroidales bacterium]